MSETPNGVFEKEWFVSANVRLVKEGDPCVLECCASAEYSSQELAKRVYGQVVYARSVALKRSPHPEADFITIAGKTARQRVNYRLPGCPTECYVSVKIGGPGILALYRELQNAFGQIRLQPEFFMPELYAQPRVRTRYNLGA